MRRSGATGVLSAVLAVLATSQALALTPAQVDASRAAGTLKEIRIAGSSSLRLALAGYMRQICNDDLHVYFHATTAQDTAHRAYACTLRRTVGNYAPNAKVLVYKRDEGGSREGVNPIATGAEQAHLKVSAASCSGEDANPGVDDPFRANFVCLQTETTGIQSDAGISDAEPAIFQATVNVPTGTTALPQAQLNLLQSAPLVQAVFGVAVNKKAYRALQEAQGIIPPGAPMIDVPADESTWTEATLATMPTLSSSWVGAALTGSVIGGTPNSGAKKGWNRVIPNLPYSLDGGITTRPPVDVDSVVKTMNICRRTEGSGAQAVTAAFFAENPCSNSAGGLYIPVSTPGSGGSATTVAAAVTNAVPQLVQEGTHAGQVEACLAEAEAAVGGPDDTAYAIGILARESNPRRSGGDLGFRFVKLDGAAPVRWDAKAGRYGFVYEATMQWRTGNPGLSADKLAFLTAMRNDFGLPVTLASQPGDLHQGLMATPGFYTGPYVDATGIAAAFGSSVSRGYASSCSALRIVK